MTTKCLVKHVKYVIWSRKLCCRNKIISTWTLSRPFDISITRLNALDRTIKKRPNNTFKMLKWYGIRRVKRERERERNNGICEFILRNLSFQKHGESYSYIVAYFERRKILSLSLSSDLRRRIHSFVWLTYNAEFPFSVCKNEV